MYSKINGSDLYQVKKQRLSNCVLHSRANATEEQGRVVKETDENLHGVKEHSQSLFQESEEAERTSGGVNEVAERIQTVPRNFRF